MEVKKSELRLSTLSNLVLLIGFVLLTLFSIASFYVPAIDSNFAEISTIVFCSACLIATWCDRRFDLKKKYQLSLIELIFGILSFILFS